MPSKIIFTEKQIQEIINLYQSNISCKQIGKQFSCSKQTINALLKKNSIEIRDGSHAQQKYQIDENIFEIIDSQEKAYWLGMLTGDGWITNKNEFGLSLQQLDKKYIYNFKDFLKSNHPILRKVNGLKKDATESISYEVRITNKKIVSDLKKYGFTANKTHYIKFPNIDSKFLSSYILGLVDSDGSFCLKSHYKNKEIKLLNFSFIGPTEFVEIFQSILISKCNISKTKLGTQKNTDFIRVVEYGGYKNIYKIVKFLYNDSSIWMERKKSIAINYLLTKYINDQWLINQLDNAPSP
jgi:intein-encoded DNA endonuclease-like protein